MNSINIEYLYTVGRIRRITQYPQYREPLDGRRTRGGRRRVVVVAGADTGEGKNETPKKNENTLPVHGLLYEFTTPSVCDARAGNDRPKVIG